MSLSVLMPADVRFPLERANGVQILKTAGALARAGIHTTLMVRHSDPRRTDEIMALYGIAPDPNLLIRRLPVLHRTGSFALPRAAFLARTAAAIAAARGSLVFTRDLQLADLLTGLGPLIAPVVYEAHAVETLLYNERGALYGTGERPNPRKARRLLKREGRVWRRAAGFVTTTAGIRATFEETYGPRANVAVVPNGCDVPAERSFPPLPEGTPRVVYAGQLYPWKGVDVLVEAVAEIPEARLVILGGLELEDDLHRIRALVARLGLNERVELPGTVPQAQVAAELEQASVVAVPFLKGAMTERHTSPIKLFEALAAGRPIVATDLPSTREVLADSQDALLVPAGDATALAAAIRRLIEDRELAERLARAAFDKAPEYSWDARAARIKALLEAL
ncbi:MAG TPA: glycosyltransferase family 4 protein [Vicinamibacteria bacterium]|nr:glycosyltransferase family 4 protein [Vicinamibacteria bacterium]